MNDEKYWQDRTAGIRQRIIDFLRENRASASTVVQDSMHRSWGFSREEVKQAIVDMLDQNDLIWNNNRRLVLGRKVRRTHGSHQDWPEVDELPVLLARIHHGLSDRTGLTALTRLRAILQDHDLIAPLPSRPSERAMAKGRKRKMAVKQ
jgi:hypothetical protein